MNATTTKSKGGTMRYGVWNNKGGVGKTFLSFVVGCELAEKYPERSVVWVDMCPQANLSEIVLGGNGKGAKNLQKFIDDPNDRKTIGGYFDARIDIPQKPIGTEASYLVHCKKLNHRLSDNQYLLVGDPSLELQGQVISQISAQTLPAKSWENVHKWVSDLLDGCAELLGADTIFIIDCNPSFSTYTELAMVATEELLIPCSSDGSSARAIDNMAALIFGIQKNEAYKKQDFSGKCKHFKIPLPKIKTIILNRSTQYDAKASKAFAAMFDEIKERTNALPDEIFVNVDSVYCDIPDSHSVAIVCSHYGMPLHKLTVGKYDVHDERPQVNEGPLERYKEATEGLMSDF